MDFYITCNGKKLQEGVSPPNGIPLRIQPRLVGGKGGFGSMLRAIGARIEKTTNHEACRDLSGRRMRDVNNEKQISEWVQDQDTKQKEKAEKRQQKLERTLNPKMRYEDKDYTLSLQGNVDKINEAMKVASEKGKDSKVGDKRKSGDQITPSGKKSRAWLGMDGLSDESECSDIDADDIVKVAEVVVDKECSETKQATPKEKVESPTIVEKTVEENSDTDKKVETNIQKVETKTQKQEPEYLDLEEFRSAEELQSVGLERLKSALMFHGMKCGGMLHERADRLFLTKEKTLDQLDSSLFVKKGSQKSKKSQKSKNSK